MAEILRHSAFLGWAAEYFEGDSLNLAGIFLHNSVQTKFAIMCCTLIASAFVLSSYVHVWHSFLSICHLTRIGVSRQEFLPFSSVFS